MDASAGLAEISSNDAWDIETTSYDLGPYDTLRALNSDVANQIVMSAALNWERLRQRLIAHSHAVVTSTRDDGSIEFYASVLTTYLHPDSVSPATQTATGPITTKDTGISE